MTVAETPSFDRLKIPYIKVWAASLLLGFCMLARPGLVGGGTPPPDARSALVIESWSLPGILGGGVKSNDSYTDGSFFLTYPAYSSIGREGLLAGDVIFIEPYSSWGEQGEVVASLGLGWRHLFTTQSTSAITHHDGHQAGFLEEGAFIGANLFVDMLDTQFDNRFWQLGFGLEAGTRYLEARANYYLPLTDRQLAEEIRTKESVTSSTTVPTYDEPFATGHTIQQDVTLTTFATTTTIERLFRRYEDGMEGWDAELALLLPWVDRWMDVKLMAGYYAFDNQPFGPQAGGAGNVEGWKAGLEVRPVPAVVLNATWYEDDRLTGGDWMAGVRLELPFEAGDLGDGKGLWGRLRDAFRPRRRHLAERMAEPVRRQNAAIKISSSVEEDKSATEVKVVTKVVSQGKTRVVLADTVVFVDNQIGSPSNPGTYEAPLDTIANGMNLGAAAYGDRAVVFVEGRPQVYGESVVFSRGARLFGSGSFPALGGRFFDGRTNQMPVVNGGFFAQNIASTVQVTGFDIRGGLVGTPDVGVGFDTEGSGIVFYNVANGIATNNIIRAQYTGANHAFGILARSDQGSSRYYLGQNVIVGGGAGIYVVGDGNAAVNAGVVGNLVTGSIAGPAVTVQLVANSRGQFTVDSNVMMNSSSGLWASTHDNARGSFFISNNRATNNQTSGMDLLSYDLSRASYFFESNVVAGNAGGGVSMLASGIGAQVTAWWGGNAVLFNKGDQISVGDGLGGQLSLFTDGELSNDVREIPGEPGFLYRAQGSVGGSIFINGVLRPANATLP